MEKTLIFIKPDAVKRGLCGEIILRFERAGLKLTEMRFLMLTKRQADSLYPDDKEWLLMLSKKVEEAFARKGKRFGMPGLAYGRRVKGYLVDYVTSGPVLAFVAEGNEAISVSRKLVGSTDASVAAPGTIRGDYGNDSLYAANMEKRANMTLVHAAGTPKEARDQIKMIFG